MDVSPDDLADYIFTFSGCPADQIPQPGYAWFIGAGATEAPAAIDYQALAEAVNDDAARRLAS